MTVMKRIGTTALQLFAVWLMLWVFLRLFEYYERYVEFNEQISLSHHPAWLGIFGIACMAICSQLVLFLLPRLAASEDRVLRFIMLAAMLVPLLGFTMSTWSAVFDLYDYRPLIALGHGSAAVVYFITTIWLIMKLLPRRFKPDGSRLHTCLVGLLVGCFLFFSMALGERLLLWCSCILDDGPYHGIVRKSSGLSDPDQIFDIGGDRTLEVYDAGRDDASGLTDEGKDYHHRVATLLLRDRDREIVWCVYASDFQVQRPGEPESYVYVDEVDEIRFRTCRRTLDGGYWITGDVIWSYGGESVSCRLNRNAGLCALWYTW